MAEIPLRRDGSSGRAAYFFTALTTAATMAAL